MALAKAKILSSSQAANQWFHVCKGYHPTILPLPLHRQLLSQASFSFHTDHMPVTSKEMAHQVHVAKCVPSVRSCLSLSLSLSLLHSSRAGCCLFAYAFLSFSFSLRSGDCFHCRTLSPHIRFLAKNNAPSSSSSSSPPLSLPLSLLLMCVKRSVSHSASKLAHGHYNCNSNCKYKLEFTSLPRHPLFLYSSSLLE